jgi:hypothetical protein
MSMHDAAKYFVIRETGLSQISKALRMLGAGRKDVL